MSDNSDLLGAAPVAAQAADKPKRGRPRKVPEALQTAEPQPPDPNATVPAGTTPEQVNAAGLALLTGEDPLATLTSTPEADDSVSAGLPPVSTEYAAAMANRVQIVGQSRREYAWQRLKRAGKRI
jgi:hypothetical protein